MILQNKKGNERNFKIICKLIKNKKEYIIYKDIITSKVYAGLKENDTLKRITKEERMFLENLMERISGS